MDTRRAFRGITRKCSRIRSAPGGATNTLRGLTHQPDAAGRGLAMKATRFVGPAANLGRTHNPRTPIIIPARVAQRAATKYVLDEDGCHISTYSVASHGYAQIGWHEGGGARRGTTAHRAAWVYAHGTQIPAGMTIDHLCKERRCVNPEHLRMLTNYENARRTSGRDWPIGQCVNGHPNSEIVRVDGDRYKCGVCVAEWRRRGRDRRAS